MSELKINIYADGYDEPIDFDNTRSLQPQKFEIPDNLKDVIAGHEQELLNGYIQQSYKEQVTQSKETQLINEVVADLKKLDEYKNMRDRTLRRLVKRKYLKMLEKEKSNNV